MGSAAACDMGESSKEGLGGAPPSCDPTTISPGDAPVRRMTHFEYNNTVHDLLGDTTAPADAFPPDEVSGGFNNQASTLVVTELLAESYMTAAEALAATAVQDLGALTGCDPAQASPSACGAQFIERFGKRAFRRPLDADARALLTSVLGAALAQWDYPTAIRLVITAALESPRFLYRFESGMADPAAPGAIAKLDDYEVASRLSYLLWGSMPDDALFAAADQHALSTPDQVAAQARRMLADPRARAMVQNFSDQWLGLDALATADKDAKRFPRYTPKLKDTWKAETMAFVTDVVFDHGGDLGTLISAPYTMMNADVAAFYGVAGGPTGAGFVHVDLDPAQRAGLLTQPSLLAVTAHADQTSPVRRGKLVRERLLCQILPPPPPDVDTVPPSVAAGGTTRQRFMEHEQDAVCAGCHYLMDPIGFGFEHYDPLGLWRDTDQGQPIDASGVVSRSQDANGPFDGAVALAQRLAQSDEVRACVVSQWFTYGQGRPVTSEDGCSIGTLQTAFAAAHFDIKELLLALTQTDAFLYRKAVTPGK
jgi:hypothetical protein